MGKSIVVLGAFATATIAVSGLMARWTNSILNSVDPLIRISKQTGVATQYIQEMGYAATMSGSSIEAVESTILSLSRKIGSATLRGNEDFTRLGISVRKATGEIKTADEVLEEVGKRFKEMNLSLSQQVTIADSLGIDSTMIEILGKTSRQIKELRNESKGFGILTKEQTEQVDSYNRSVAKLRFNFEGMKRIIAVGLSPELEKLAKMFDFFLLKNQDSIIKGINKFAETVGELLKFIGRIYPVLLSLAGVFLVIKAATVGIVSAFGGWVVIIPALIAALALLIDDLSMPAKGGKSIVIEKTKGIIDYVGAPGKFILDLFRNNSNSSGSNIEQNILINVKANEARQAAEEIKNSLKDHLEDAKTQLQTSGM